MKQTDPLATIYQPETLFLTLAYGSFSQMKEVSHFTIILPDQEVKFSLIKTFPIKFSTKTSQEFLNLCI